MKFFVPRRLQQVLSELGRRAAIVQRNTRKFLWRLRMHARGAERIKDAERRRQEQEAAAAKAAAEARAAEEAARAAAAAAAAAEEEASASAVKANAAAAEDVTLSEESPKEEVGAAASGDGHLSDTLRREADEARDVMGTLHREDADDDDLDNLPLARVATTRGLPDRNDPEATDFVSGSKLLAQGRARGATIKQRNEAREKRRKARQAKQDRNAARAARREAIADRALRARAVTDSADGVISELKEEVGTTPKSKTTVAPAASPPKAPDTARDLFLEPLSQEEYDALDQNFVGQREIPRGVDALNR